MIQAKLKPCKKGSGPAIGFIGCGNKAFLHRYGLCKECFKNFLYDTPAGEKVRQKAQIRAKTVVQKEAKKEQSIKKEENRQKKIELMGVDKYRAGVVQPIINEIARLIDHNCPCIATGLYDGKQAGGHYHSTGSNRTIALSLHNIHVQSFHSNGPTGGGDNIRYRNGIIRTYGQSYMDKIEALSMTPAIHLSKADLIEVKERASAIRLELKANLKYRTPEERIALRDELNIRIGIYKSIFI